MDVKRISIDTPKHTFTLHGVDLQERPILQREIRRAQLEPFFAKLELTVDPGNFQSGRHLAACIGLVKLVKPAMRGYDNCLWLGRWQ
jgi:transposase